MKSIVRIIFPILIFVYLYLTIIEGTFVSFDNYAFGSDISLSIVIVHFLSTFLIIYLYFKNNKKKRKGIIDDKEILYNKIYYLFLLMIINILYFWIFLPFNEIANREFGLTFNGVITYSRDILLYYLILDSLALIFGSILLFRLIRDFFSQVYVSRYNNINRILFILFFVPVMYSKYIYLLRVYSIITTP